jgi:uncharacterized protein (DUF849 family)
MCNKNHNCGIVYTAKQSLCDTCRHRFDCHLPDAYGGCLGYERQPNPLDEIATETRSLNPIKEENKMESWKVRLKEEYAQLKERYEKLKAYNNTQEVKLNIADKAQTATEHYRYRLLDQQQRAMGEYLHILELRAVLESIDLN